MQLLRRRFALDGDRTDVVERVVVHADRLEESAVDEPPLKARARLIEHVGEHVGRVRRRRILPCARALPLQHHDDRSNRLLDDDRRVCVSGGIGGIGSVREADRPALAIRRRCVFASANAFSAATSPVTMIAVLFGT